MKGKIKKQLGRGWARIIKGALGVIKSAIASVIKDPIGVELWLLSLKPTDDIVDALSDKDPENGKQVQAIIQNYTNSDVIPFGEGKFNDLVSRIENPQIKDLARVTGQIPFAIGKIYTDNNPQNEQQLKEFLEKWVEDGGNQADIARAVGAWIDIMFKKNPAIAMFINETIQARIEDGELFNVDWDGDGV
jgi:hypothetical protein